MGVKEWGKWLKRSCIALSFTARPIFLFIYILTLVKINKEKGHGEKGEGEAAANSLRLFPPL